MVYIVIVNVSVTVRGSVSVSVSVIVIGCIAYCLLTFCLVFTDYCLLLSAYGL